MKKIYSLIAIIMATVLMFGSVNYVFAAEERELTNDEKAAFIVRDEWTSWVRDFTASLSELDKTATAKIYDGMDFYDMQYRFTQKYKKVPEYMDAEGKPTQKLQDMIKEKRKEINLRKTTSSGGSSEGMINWNSASVYTWMSKLPDDRYLNDINIPGAANSMCYTNGGDDAQKCAFYRQNGEDISTHLSHGFRAFDVSLRYFTPTGGTADAYIVSAMNKKKDGAFYRYQTTTKFSEVMRQCITYLNSYTRETIVLIIKDGGNSDSTEMANLRNRIQTILTSGTVTVSSKTVNVKDYVYTGKTWPKLKDVRKKIVILTRIPTLNTTNGIGIKLTDYANGNLVSGYVTDGVSMFYDNHEYHLTAAEKVSYVSDALDVVTAKSVSTSGKGKNFSIIYTGGYKYDDSGSSVVTVLPNAVASSVNSAINSYSFTQGKLVGCLMMEHVNVNLARKIFSTNP